jgi:hypothetical protein
VTNENKQLKYLNDAIDKLSLKCQGFCRIVGPHRAGATRKESLLLYQHLWDRNLQFPAGSSWKNSSVCPSRTHLLRAPRALPRVSHQTFKSYCWLHNSYIVNCRQRIEYLIQKWRFDHSTTLVDESKEDFTSYYYPPPSYKYGPSNNIKQEGYYPEPIYIPKPNYAFDPSTRVGNAYIPPHPYNATQSFAGYPDRRAPAQYYNYKYSNNIPPSGAPRDVYGPPAAYSALSLPQVNPYVNKVWNRKDEKYGKAILIRKKRSEMVSRKMRKLKSVGQHSNSTMHERTKRQSALTGQSLCTARSQFIMPRAALNNKGNWMYVVNMPELDNRFTQLVKSETCA